MSVLKPLLFVGLILPSVVVAASTSVCKVSFHQFIVDRVPGGYPVNPATLTVLHAGSCLRKDNAGSEGVATTFILRDTIVEVVDSVTRKHQSARSTTSIDIDSQGKLAWIYNNYLGLDIKVPFILKNDRIIISLTRPPVQVSGPRAAPYYRLRMGSEVTITVPSTTHRLSVND